MATKQLTIQLIAEVESFVRGLNKVTKQLDDASRDMTNFGKRNFIAFTGLTIAMVGFAKAAQESEQVEMRLATALQLQGRYTKQTTQELIDYATALSRSSLFTDESIAAVEGTLVAFGLQTKQVKISTKAIVDYAQFTGKGLEMSALIIGQAIGGATDNVRGLDVALTGVTDTQVRAALITNELTRRFEGQAVAATKGYGAINQMFNEVNNLAEALGKSLAPVILPIIKGLTDMAVKMQGNRMFSDMTAWAITLTAAMYGINTVFGFAGGAILKFISILTKLFLLLKMMGIFLMANPIGLALLAIGAAVFSLYYAFKTNFMGITDIVKNAFEYLYGHFKWFANIVNWIKGVWSSLPWTKGAAPTPALAGPPTAEPGGAQPMTKTQAEATAAAAQGIKTSAEDFTKAMAEGLAKGSLDINMLMSQWAEQVLIIWLNKMLNPLTETMKAVGDGLMNMFSNIFGGMVTKATEAFQQIIIMAFLNMMNIVGGIFGGLGAILGGIFGLFFAGGSWNVPYGPALALAGGTDSIPAMLTPGEMVIPRSIAQSVRSGETSIGSGGGINVSFEGTKFYGSVPKQVAFEIGEQIGMGIKYHLVAPLPTEGQ